MKTTKNASTADNQQETNNDSNYYISGFCAGEMSCSVIKQTRTYGSGFSYSPDFTITNADIDLLKQINMSLAKSRGVISKVKGAFNLSFRGKHKVKSVLCFFANYPIIVGKLAKSRLFLLEKACSILDQKQGSTKRLKNEIWQIEQIRSRLREIKTLGNDAITNYSPLKNPSRRAIGFFLSGVFDADGSIGLRKRGKTYQPFLAVAMKDKEIPLLFQKYLNFGYIYRRSKSNMYHFETGKRTNVYEALKTFMFQFPSRQSSKKRKLEKLFRILNDYTHNATDFPIYYDGELW